MAYWAAAQLQAYRERKAEYFLKQIGFEVYLLICRGCGAIGFVLAATSKRCGRLSRLLLHPHRVQRHGVKQCPGVLRLVKAGGDEPAHVADEVIDALRSRERNGAIDLPKKGASLCLCSCSS